MPLKVLSTGIVAKVEGKHMSHITVRWCIEQIEGRLLRHEELTRSLIGNGQVRNQAATKPPTTSLISGLTHIEYCHKQHVLK